MNNSALAGYHPLRSFCIRRHSSWVWATCHVAQLSRGSRKLKVSGTLGVDLQTYVEKAADPFRILLCWLTQSQRRSLDHQSPFS